MTCGNRCAIEQDADMVMFCTAGEYYDITSKKWAKATRETHVRIAKHRNGSLETLNSGHASYSKLPRWMERIIATLACGWKLEAVPFSQGPDASAKLYSNR